MPAPPKPKPKGPEDLAEVERALSVLQGRHPEHERLRREDHENQQKRSAEIEAVANVETRRVRSRRALIGIGVGAVAVIAASAAVFFRSELARRGRIEQAADPYRAMGFTLVETSSRGQPAKLEATAPPGCILATSTTKAPVRIAYPGGVVEGATPVFTCLCEEAKVSVTSPVAKEGEGLVLLRADAATFGGSRAFAFLPFKPGAVNVGDQACAEASLDAWLDGKRWSQESPEAAAAAAAAAGSAAPAGSAAGEARRNGPRPSAPVDDATSERWLAADPKYAALRGAGFKVAAFAKREAPFTIVEVPAESCVLLLNDRATNKTSVRLKAGTFAVEPVVGNAGWCTATGALVLAQREGEGELAVLVAPAARAGGLYGLRETAESAGIALGSATVAAGDRGWSAKQLLLASGVPETLITIANTPDLGKDPEARIVALSVETPNLLVPELPPDVFSFCDPSLDKSTATLCVFAGPQKWRVDGAETIGGLARAKAPFWLFGLQSVNEPAALKVQTEIIGLSRRLRRQGFEPTTMEAVTELDKGAEILGRANEDGMVAFTLAPVAPYVFPYTDGPAWTISGEPRVVPIKPLERITLTTSAKTPLPPKGTRRTVVFRHHK